MLAPVLEQMTALRIERIASSWTQKLFDALALTLPAIVRQEAASAWIATSGPQAVPPMMKVADGEDGRW